MADANGSAEQEIDLAALQAQLQADRARLAEQVSSRLSSISPQKGGSSSRKSSNPFAMPGSSSGSSASSSSLPFQHRPATLGLGATPTNSQQQQSVQDRRLKGALLAGKRKRGEDVDAAGHDDEDASFDADSKSAMIVNGKGKDRALDQNGHANGKPAKHDPFARKKKNKAAPVQDKTVATNAKAAPLPVAEESENIAAPIANGAMNMEGLSKSAKKKLKKKLKMQEQQNAKGVDKNVSRQSNDGSDEEDNANTSMAGAAPVNGMSKAVNGKASSRDADLTPAQRAMQLQLSGARFRQINETLYTTTSQEAVRMVAEEPEVLRDYHAGFREQVKGWPQVPVRQIYEELESAQTGGQSSKANGDVKRKAANGNSTVRESLGKKQPGALVVDLGAGDGFLAQWVAASKTLSALQSPPRILSFDLLDSADGFVRGIDIAKAGAVPLPGRSVGSEDGEDDDMARCADVAVFCLALMATNWLESILEASRILRPGGELLIAEVASRLTDRKQFVQAVEACGFKCKREDTSNTHFVRFDFVKKRAQTWRAPFATAAERKTFIAGGAGLLKPCIYKRR